MMTVRPSSAASSGVIREHWPRRSWLRLAEFDKFAREPKPAVVPINGPEFSVSFGRVVEPDSRWAAGDVVFSTAVVTEPEAVVCREERGRHLELSVVLEDRRGSVVTAVNVGHRASMERAPFGR